MTATDSGIFDGTDALAWDPKSIHYRNKSLEKKSNIIFRLKIYKNPNRDLPRSNVFCPGLKFLN